MSNSSGPSLRKILHKTSFNLFFHYADAMSGEIGFLGSWVGGGDKNRGSDWWTVGCCVTRLFLTHLALSILQCAHSVVREMG